jgi:hypothetical protein
MDPNIERDFQAVFDAHDQAIRALKDANVGMGAAIAAHDEAIQAALAATHAALALFRRLTSRSGEA